MTTNIRRMFGNLLTTSKFLKVMSAVVLACMLISLTACGTATQQNTHATTQYETESEPDDGPQDPGHEPGDGYWHNEEPSSTEEPISPTEEPSSTEEPVNPPTGAYTYNVDGVQITLRTNIEGYISERTGALGPYQAVNMLAIAESLGYEHVGTMGDGSEVDPGRITNFSLANNPEIKIYLDDKRDQGFYTVRMYLASGETTVTFDRCDIANDSIATYWIVNSEDGAVVNTVNFEEIVIFTYLLENGSFAPSEDWMETCGISTSTGPSVFHVNK